MSTTYSRTETGSHPEPAGSNEAIGRLRAIDRDRLPSDGGHQFNRLIFSASPYLLQHAENPVDWWPWGEESFAAARDENKPVFLSIGYATCHWCHVMAHESFEDEEVAQFLNRHFIPIKVDREERPDVDDQYMTAAQMMSGSGGWPLTIVMNPDRQPFFAATYLPKQARQGMPGLMEILAQIASLWNSDRSRIERHCAAILEALKESEQLPPPPDNCSPMSEKAEQQLRSIYDSHLGGFGRAPKFPMPLNHLFLINRWEKTGNPHLLDMVASTLRRMRQGGIYDQIGYGFHRYSVDREWLVPHFEKMLYDQALLALVYLKAGQVAEEPLFTAVASEILTFVLRDLTLDGGGFACALDADSEGCEGACYVWSPDSVKKVVGDEADLCCRFFGISAQGNFEGDSIPTFPRNAAELAGEFAMSPEQLAAAVERWRHTLLDARMQRIQPLRDEKVVTAWNGLAIAALARGYSATGRKEYLDAAEQAVGFIRVNLTTADGRLLRSWFDGRANIAGFLEDYSFLLWGLLELHAATRDSAWLAEAELLADRMIATFGEIGKGWLHDSAGEELLVCRPNLHDGVIPSGNSTAAMVLLALGQLTGNDRYTTSGRDIVAACLGEVSRQPLTSLFLIMAAECCS